MTTVFRLRFFKETGNDLLHIFCWYFDFLVVLLFFLVKNFLETGTNVSDFTLFVSDTNKWSFSDLELLDICNKQQLLTHRADSSLELQ